jgi:3-oxoacyl-[acyl-carrier protein] reductase
MDLGLKEKTAIVTAASRGLGRAAATSLAREGAQLAICSRSEQIHAVAAEIRQATGAQVQAYQVDLNSAAQVERFIAQASEALTRVDILVANAGGPPPGAFLALKPEDWDAAYQGTVMSAVRLCYGVLPSMVRQGSGSIVFCQSYSVKQPVENLILSNALRMAVIGLAKSLANELGPQGIRINSLNPAWTLTERVDQLMRDRATRSGGTPQAEIERLTAGIPLRRMGTAEEFGDTVAWLASPAASFIHGHALFFDGGATQSPL